jgi:dipeptidase E
MKLLLTSNGLTNEKITNAFLSLVGTGKTVTIAILSTKFEGSAANVFSEQVKIHFNAIGFEHADILDLETLQESELEKYDVLYVCGGNTFEILSFAKQANLKQAVEKLFARNGVYVGVSAGSIIVGPHIHIANEVEADPNSINLQDLTGLHIANEIICPHYLAEHEQQVLAFENKYNTNVIRLTDNQALVVTNNGVQSI